MSVTTQTITQVPTLSVSRLPEKNEPIFTIDELIKRRASEMEDMPLIGYPKAGLIDFEEHSARAVDRYVDAAVQKLQGLGLQSTDPSLEKAPVVGILAQSGLHVIITELALSRLGYAVLLLSTRLPSPAISQLVKLAGCNILLTTENFHPVLAEVQQDWELSILPLLSNSDFYGVDAPVFSRTYDAQKERKKVAIVIHSSGSTGLPKPIYLTHSSCIPAFATNMNRRGLLTSPLFHAHGFYELFRAIYSKKPIYLCNYNLPLTGYNVKEMINYVKPEIFHSVPYVIKLLAESDEGIQALASADVVLYAGSGCPDDIGDQLVERGVNLVGNYGSTETGRLMTSLRPAGDKLWSYLRPLASAKPYIFWDEISPGIYECVALDGLPSKSTINSDDPPNSFRTRDLFTPHPTLPDHWKYVSRLDDRLTLINGEKVLPLPMEGRIRQEEIVREAIIFGEGRSYPGVIIVKAERAAQMSNDEFLEKIWPAVESANARAEKFAHIPKDLIIVLPADTVYPRTDKGTFIRVPMYRQFEQEIQAVYDNFEHEDGGTLVLEGEELESYLLKRLNERLGVQLSSSEADFFAAGIDSLQCIQIWNLIKKELDLGGRQAKLGQNVLYDTGNIKALARHLDALRTGKEDAAKDELQKMQDLIAKYSSFKTHVSGTAPQPEKELALLTGVTGGLGAHILSQLVSRPDVSAVWAMVRAPNDVVALERVSSSLKSRGITLDPEQQAKVVALSCDLSKADFGLDQLRLGELRSKLTLVIHSAWAVNFNISVQSFEDQHIKAVHNLIQLCQSIETPQPARFFFCSSVSSAGGTPRPGTVIEGPVQSPSHAQGTGYARSKFVSEHITRNAMKDAGAAARVLRIGQLIGDSKVGEWNATEGIPLMIQTAVTLGALPTLDEEMTWLQVDYAAATIVELAYQSATRSSDPDIAYHVLNPSRFHWTRDMLPALAQAGLDFETLPTDQWMEKLRNSDRDPTKNPPIKLLDWFESKYGNGASKTNKGGLVYLTDETKKDSESLRKVPDVTEVSFVRMMLERLREHWESTA